MIKTTLIRLTRIGAAFVIPAALLAVSFEPNQGQTSGEVKYLARTSGGVLFLTAKEAVLQHGGDNPPVRLEFVGANPGAAWLPTEASAETTSYHIGRDSSKWVEGVRHYGRIVRRAVYPGIDLAWYGADGQVEYDFILAPHADPSRIRIRVSGGRRISLAEDGALVITTADGDLRQPKPAIYQTLADGSHKVVDGAFRFLARREIGFTVAGYDPGLPLSIDPVIDSSTYLGGSLDDRIVAADNTGRAVGMITSVDFPGAPFARRRGSDILVRVSSSQSQVFGGSGDEQVTSVVFGPSSPYSILIGGYTDSKDLPATSTISQSTGTTINAWQRDFAGGATDGFFLALGVTNNGVPTSFLSYIGTPGDDRVTGVAGSFGTLAIVGTTNGRGLPSPTFVNPAPQPEPAGGVDGFFMTVVNLGSSFSGPAIQMTTYLGGSGDDRPLAVQTSLYSSLDFYITGETTSPDFPLVNPLSAQRSGDSDAFLMHIANQAGKFTIAQSTLFGGSGVDRGVQLTRFLDGTILLAGVTLSTDLPLQNPVQVAYGGGDSDSFVAEFTPDLSQMIVSTYLGGSGADEATSAAADVYGNLFVGGWTSSQDFPVRNAVQPSFGGGPDDGFLVHFDTDGSLYQATYFGGSGSDRIRGLYAPGGPVVTLAGETTSPDLPLQNAMQDSLKGTRNGFVAQIGANTLLVGPAFGGKDLRTWVTLLGDGITNGLAPVTVTSSDPTKVLLAIDTTSPGKASITWNPGAPGTYYAFYMDCLDDQGGADLTVEAAGYVTRIVHASCFPAKAGWFLSSSSQGGYVSSSSNIQANPWSGPGTIILTLFSVDPNHPNQSNGGSILRPGADPVAIQAVSSNPAVASISPVATLSSSNTNASTLSLQPLAVGETQISLSSSRVQLSPSDTIKVVVISPLRSTPSFAAPAGFQTSLSLSAAGGRTPDTPPTVTLTSQDPSKVALSLNASQPGTGSVTVPFSSFFASVQVQALASEGDVPVTVSIPGFDPTSFVVSLAPAAASLSASTADLSKPLSLGGGESVFVSALVGPKDRPLTHVFAPNPGNAPLQFSLDNSNPAVVDIVAQGSTAFLVRGASEGFTNLTLHPPSGLPLSSTAGTVAVTVKKKLVQIGDFDLGKDLATLVTLTIPYAPSTAVPVTITSSDPALVVLSADNRAAGQNILNLSFNVNSNTLKFWAQGLASTGQATITADVAGYGQGVANVKLGPSGFGWNVDTASTILYSPFPAAANNEQLGVDAFVLDPVSLLPLGAGALRAGMSSAVQISNSNPDVVSLGSNPVTFASGQTNSSAGLRGRAVGDALLTINTPAGFLRPAIRQQLPVKIQTPTLGFNNGPYVLAKDAQLSLGVGIPTGATGPITITSGDPSRLLVSTSATVLGSASIATPDGRFYIQALASQGDVSLTASAPGFNDGKSTVHLVPMGVGLALYQFGGSTIGDGKYLTTTQSPITPITLTLQGVDPNSGALLTSVSALRPGVDGWQVEVRSSNTAAGTILRSPARVPISQGFSATVDFKPVGIGETDVTLVQPDGFGTSPAGQGKLTFAVSAPKLMTNLNEVVGKNTVSPNPAQLPDNVSAPENNVTVTITSSDPSRLLLSNDVNSPPAASITKILIAGQRFLGTYYVHALTNEGSATIKLSAPGYADTINNVLFTDATFRFENVSSDIHVVPQNGPQTVRIALSLAPLKPAPAGYGTYSPSIRPGVPDVPVTVSSSDPNVVGFDNPVALFKAGDSNVQFTYNPLRPGQATVSLNPPDGYLRDATQGLIVVNVDAPKLSLSAPSLLGRDLQAGISIGADGGFRQQTRLTVTSSDPSKLLVSTSSTTPGQASISFLTPPNTSGPVFIQALADDGTATVTVSADGYQSSTSTIRLGLSAAVFFTSSMNISTNAGVQHLPVGIATLDPATLRPSGAQTPRPGANLSVSVTSSDTKVLSVNSPTVTLTADTQFVDARPVAAGTAILSLGLLPGGVSPASGRQIVFNVTDSR